MKLFSNYSINFVKLVCGTAGGQIVNFITLPVLTRMYAVSDFGIQAIYSAIASILFVFATGRYEMAILLPKEDKDSFALCIATVCLATISCVVIEIIVWLISCEIFIIEVFGLSSDIMSWLPFLPITIFVQVMYSVLYTWLNRKRVYYIMARMAVITALGNFGGAFIYGYITNAESHGLLLNTFIGFLFCIVYMLFFCKKNNYLPMKYISLQGVKRVMIRYKHFPSFLIASNVIQNGANQMPVFILNIIGGTSLTGIYSMVYKVLQVPIGLIGKSMGEVFMREASCLWQEKGMCWSVYCRTFKLLAIMGVAPFLVLGLFSMDLLSFVFGNEWGKGGVYLSYLCPMFYIMFVDAPLSTMFYIAERTRLNLLSDCVRFVLVCVSMIGAYKLYNTVDSVIISYGIALGVYFIWDMLLTMKWSKGEMYFS